MNLGQFAARPSSLHLSCRCWRAGAGQINRRDGKSMSVAVAVGPPIPSCKKPHARVLPAVADHTSSHPWIQLVQLCHVFAVSCAQPTAAGASSFVPWWCALRLAHPRAPHARLSRSRRVADRVDAGQPPPITVPWAAITVPWAATIFFSFFLEQKIGHPQATGE